MSEFPIEKTDAKPRSRTLLPVILLVVIFSFIPIAGRVLFRDRIAELPEYRLDAEKIRITSPPEWVGNDFVREVLHASGLDTDASLLDKSLPQKLSQAFSVAPWVEEVRRVEIRYPSGAHIELVYRTPVALVAVASQGLYPVDGNGVLLPTDYFIKVAPQKKNEFPVIEGIGSTPLGTAGTLWGDPLVHVGAQLARILGPVAPELELVKIRVIREAVPNGERLVGHLRTAGETEIVWGRIDPTAPKNSVKIQRLREYAKLYESLDNVPSGFQPIDLTGE